MAGSAASSRLSASFGRAWLPVLGLFAAASLVATPSAYAGRVPAASASVQVRLGTAPSRPAGTQVVGAVAGSTQIPLTITLQPRDPSALAGYATEVSTPGSAVFRHYLTVAEFRRRFAPTDAQIEVVQQSLEANGLEAGTVTPNGLAIELSGTATALGRAFSTSLERVALPNGRTAYANTQAPQLEGSVAGAIQSVIGLNDLAREQPLRSAPPRPPVRAVQPRSTSQVVTGGPQPCQAATTTGTDYRSYTADQLASAYRFSSLYGEGDEGAGQTVAIFELEPNLTSDIAAYQSCYGTSAPVSYVTVDSGSGSGAGSGEAALDIEDIIGLAPKASDIVYQGPNSERGVLDTYSKIITSDDASVISTSWGLCEQDEGSSDADAENTLFQEAATQGMSVFASAGDAGSEDCGDNQLAVDDPGSQPFVTSVGGTSLTALGPPPTQSVWDDACPDGPCGGGGGVSMLWPMPTFQSEAPPALDVINHNSSGTQCGATSGYCREVPDVSADADPRTGYVMYFGGGWTDVGGTSAAAPLWAAFTALVDSSPGCAGKAIGFANPDLYAAAGSDYAANFNDITSGNNDIVAPLNGDLYPAGTGYDMASGLGTPIGSSLPSALCTGITVEPPGDQTGVVGIRAGGLPILASSDSGATLRFAATGLPPGLSIGPSTGIISGTPTAAGASTVNVTVSASGGGSSTTSFSWNVATRSTETSVSCSPPSVPAFVATTCTATVTDTAAGTATAPTGTVTLTSTPAGAGTFASGGSCTLAGTLATGVAGCQLAYTPSAMGAQTVAAGYAGNATHASSTVTPTQLAVTTPAAPQNTSAPAIAGTAKSGATLSCGSGVWTNGPSSFTYQWSRNGTTIAGATASTYTVRTPDEGSTLRCTVTAINPSGAGPANTSNGVSVPVPHVAGCPAAAGRLSGTTLGLIRLGESRKAARSAYARDKDHHTSDTDLFCFTPLGLEAGYPSPALLKGDSNKERSKLSGHVVWLETANAHYAIDGVDPGATLTEARHALAHGTSARAGGSEWYLARDGAATAVIEARGGIVQEVGIASTHVTGTAEADKAFLKAFG